MERIRLLQEKIKEKTGKDVKINLFGEDFFWMNLWTFYKVNFTYKLFLIDLDKSSDKELKELQDKYNININLNLNNNPAMKAGGVIYFKFYD